MAPTIPTLGTLVFPLQAGGIVPKGSRVNVFQNIYWVFLILGTLVGVVVIGYMLYNAYKYRDTGDRTYDESDRPELGELPTGGGKGRKLFLSFAISAVIVISLIVWTYGTLLYVEQGAAKEPAGQGDPVEVVVVGYQFGWNFYYPGTDGSANLSIESTDLDYETIQRSGSLKIPEGRQVRLIVTSRDVFHNIGIPELRAKTDAIPGQTTETWLIAQKKKDYTAQWKETEDYTAQCYELCGAGHSYMNAKVNVMPRNEFQQWYNASTENDS